MNKTHAEFLKELKNYCEKKAALKNPCYMCNGEINTYEEIAIKIEQFQAEKKQVSDGKKQI
jgi:hypothetical protein